MPDADQVYSDCRAQGAPLDREYTLTIQITVELIGRLAGLVVEAADEGVRRGCGDAGVERGSGAGSSSLVRGGCLGQVGRHGWWG